MAIYTKRFSGVMNVYGYSTGFPSPYDFATSYSYIGGFLPGEIFTYSYNDFDTKIITTYIFNEDGWGAVQTPPPAISEALSNGSYYIPNISAATALLVGVINGDFAVGIFGYDALLTNSFELVNFTGEFIESFSAAFPNWTWMAATTIINFGDAGWGGLCSVEYDLDLGNSYTFAFSFNYTDGLVLKNAYVLPLNYFPACNFPLGFDTHLTVVINSEPGYGIGLVTWSPETFINWRDGDYSSTFESLIFDDPEIQQRFNDGYAFIGTSVNDYSFFVSIYDDDFNYLYSLQAFPDTQDYIVYELIPNDPIAEEILSNYGANTLIPKSSEYRMGIIGMSGEPIYAVGIPGEPVAARSIPRYQPVRLPCIVNCIPLIDKRK